MNSDDVLRRVLHSIYRMTGRQYQIRIDLLDDDSCRELLRLLHDLEAEADAKARRAQLQWWRHA